MLQRVEVEEMHADGYVWFRIVRPRILSYDLMAELAGGDVIENMPPFSIPKTHRFGAGLVYAWGAMCMDRPMAITDVVVVGWFPSWECAAWFAMSEYRARRSTSNVITWPVQKRT